MAGDWTGASGPGSKGMGWEDVKLGGAQSSDGDDQNIDSQDGDGPGSRILEFPTGPKGEDTGADTPSTGGAGGPTKSTKGGSKGGRKRPTRGSRGGRRRETRSRLVSPDPEDRPVLPVTVILLLSLLLAMGIGAAANLVMSYVYVSPIMRIALPPVLMVILFVLTFAFISRGAVMTGQVALNTGLIVFGFSAYIFGETLQVFTDWPEALLYWAGGAMLVAVLVPSRAALVQSLFMALVWSGTEFIRTGDEIHWWYLAFSLSGLAVTRHLSWGPGFYVVIGTFAVWLGLASLNGSQILGWNQIQVASLHVLLWLGLWVLACYFIATRSMFGRLLQRMSIGLMLVAMIFTMRTYALPQDTSVLWAVAAVVGAGLVMLMSALTLARGGLTALDVFAVVSVAAFAMIYPPFNILIEDSFAPTEDFGVRREVALTLFHTVLMTLWCLWTVRVGRRESDSPTVIIGLVILLVQTSILGLVVFGYDEGIVLRSPVLATIFGALIIFAIWLRNRLGGSIVAPADGSQGGIKTDV